MEGNGEYELAGNSAEEKGREMRWAEERGSGVPTYDVFIERRTVLFDDDGRQRESVRLGLEDGENRYG